MSRVHFHSPSAETEIRGSERAWLARVANGPSVCAWDLDTIGAGLDRAHALVDLKADVPPGEYGANYLREYSRTAHDAAANHRAKWKVFEQGNALRVARGEPRRPPMSGPEYDPEPARTFITSLRTALKVQGFEITVAGHPLHTSNIDLNTALVAGSDPVALAAKIHGWCESHCWVEGSDRAWFADVIEQGLALGIYRRGLHYSDGPDKPKKWCTQGWENVLPMLRARDDEEVVLSYSVCDQFPNQWVADWQPAPVGEFWRPDLYDQSEWDELDESERNEMRAEHRQDTWYDLDNATQWELAMAGLRANRPWGRLAPDTLREVMFGPPVTVYDLWAEDRDERVARACARDAADEAAEREAAGRTGPVLAGIEAEGVVE